MKELSSFDVRPVLAKVADRGRELVRVGGQAVNFWASYYAPHGPELGAQAPFSGKDIDFCGDRKAVLGCAEAIDSAAQVPGEAWYTRGGDPEPA